MSKYNDIYAQLSPEGRKRCDELIVCLQEIGVQPGISKKIALWGNMGATNTERGKKVWMAVSWANQNRALMGGIANKGAYLWTMLQRPIHLTI